MIPTFIVIDNVFSSQDLINIQNKIKNNNINYQWYGIAQDHIYSSLCYSLIGIAGQYYDISNVIGYEIWSHINSRPPGGWHYDKDENVFEQHKIYKFPICSIVYYPLIDNLVGGELLLEQDIISPKQNRLVIFKPHIYHYVNEFSGTRYSIVINPWTTELGIVSG
jgi:hypothetical protein